ncbi:hypothetical protein A8B82_08315 [Sulfitobacter sp. EhC04]|uniref:hypothetical protein n=1 Tax=Sulfitobacter sp. EhC04 TaxID=1849168 RepID=UPI0007F48CF6|nr:hypothetical protein [Sulfitobacter sp. EhC04]OAN79400.1 hypothetical protein A8B82_08315 [Sulfitobacter sp. EhC04]
MTDTVFSYRRAGRSLRGMSTLAGVWAVLLYLLIALEAAPVVVAILAVFTLPALWDLIRNPLAGIDLSATHLRWFTGPRDALVALTEVDHIRLDTRLDFSVRASIVLPNGRKVRVPFEATPPHQAFEDALTAQGVSVKRFHFQLLQ